MKETKRKFRVEVRNEEEKKNIIHRLSRIEGQVRGISQMIEEDRAYDDVVMQMLSAVNALKGLSNHMIQEHIIDILPKLNSEQAEAFEESLGWLDKVK